MLTLKKCPFCGGEPILCRNTGVLSYVYDFSIVCSGCGIEVKRYVVPESNCCFNMDDAVKRVVDKWNSRVKEDDNGVD